MADENWLKVKEIFDVASRQNLEERRNYLNEICGADKPLLAEVESLLSSLDEAEDFMEENAVAHVADIIADEKENLAGKSFGHYEIIGQIGAGGMGAVYLAQDAKLKRRVALKILHRHLSSDKQANARLVREAQAAANLDHPNICAIYEICETDDCSFIVMQFVSGETLADILARRHLSAEESLDLAIQIADALTEAHAHHIIHRDIKPANVIVNEKGQAKVLDFGLAKFVEAETAAESAKRLSSSGAVMGTVPYMSPEQLRGHRLDAQTDIFSFGAMFYEMLCGRQAFPSENNAETISAILNDEPDFAEIPPPLQPIVRKALAKDKRKRYQTAENLTKDLRGVRESVASLSAANGESSARGKARTTSTLPSERIFSRETARQFSAKPHYYFWKNSNENVHTAPQTEFIKSERRTRQKIAKPNRAIVFFSLALIFTFVGAAIWLVRQAKKNDGSHRFDSLRPVRLISWKTGANSPYSDFRVSHDGKMIAYSSTQDGANEGIFVKQTADGEDFRVTKDQWSNHTPIWSGQVYNPITGQCE